MIDFLLFPACVSRRPNRKEKTNEIGKTDVGCCNRSVRCADERTSARRTGQASPEAPSLPAHRFGRRGGATEENSCAWCACSQRAWICRRLRRPSHPGAQLDKL